MLAPAETIGNTNPPSLSLPPPLRRHVFYLWHQWRRDQQHHCSTNGGSLGDGEPDPAEGGAARGLNGQRHLSEPMEVDRDRASMPELRDSKRLKRGVQLAAPPTLPSEHGFLSGVLDRCSNPEQRRFALAYRKWLDTVIGQQP